MIGTNSEALAYFPDLFLFDLSSIWFQIQLHGQQKFKKKEEKLPDKSGSVRVLTNYGKVAIPFCSSARSALNPSRQVTR